jgi:hypothetical protein
MMGQSKTWTDDQLENAGILTLVYGKFIEIWRQKQSYSQECHAKSGRLSNAAHQGKKPRQTRDESINEALQTLI